MKEQTKNKIKQIELIAVIVFFIVGMVGGLVIGYNAMIKPTLG